MARPNYRETKIEHGQEWETLHPISDPVDPSYVKMVMTSAKSGEIGRLYRLFERMESTDDRYGGVVSSLKRAVAKNRVRISPSNKHRTDREKDIAQEYARRVRHLMDLSTRTALKAFVEPYLKGSEVYEVDYELRDVPFFDGRAYVANGVSPVPTTRLLEGRGAQIDYGDLAILQRDGTYKPVADYRDEKVFVIKDEEIEAHYHEHGAARSVLPWWVVKQYVIRWWGEYADVYGEPLRLATISDYDLPDDKKHRLERALESLGKNGWALIPQGIEVELKDMAIGGSTGHSVYRNILSAANVAYTVRVLGQTDTTEGGEGAYAQAKIQNKVRHDIVEDVTNIAEDGLEHIADSVLSINYGSEYEPHLAPTFEIPVPAPMDLSKKARAFNTLQKKMGLAIPARQVRDEFGIDRPSTGEPVVADGMRFESEAEYLEYAEEKRERQREAAKQQVESGESPDETPPANESGNDSSGDSDEPAEARSISNAEIVGMV